MRRSGPPFGAEAFRTGLALAAGETCQAVARRWPEFHLGHLVGGLKHVLVVDYVGENKQQLVRLAG